MSEDEKLDPNLDVIMTKYKILGQRIRYLTDGFKKSRDQSIWLSKAYLYYENE